MYHRSHFPVFALVAGIGLTVCSLALRAQTDNYHGRKYKTPPPSAHIEVIVLKDFNGKPVNAAHVIFHPIEGDKDKGALELKTNEDGKALIDVIPVGDTVTLQVIANGFQTYGQVFKIDKSNMTMDVRLKRPVSQYSVYKNSTPDSGAGGSSGSGNNSPSGNNSRPGKSGGSPPSSPPPDSGSKSSGSSGGQSDPPPSGSQPQPPPK